MPVYMCATFKLSCLCPDVLTSNFPFLVSSSLVEVYYLLYVRSIQILFSYPVRKAMIAKKIAECNFRFCVECAGYTIFSVLDA